MHPLFNSRPTVLSRALAVVARAVQTDLIRRTGLIRKARARDGVITINQRFGSALNLNVHLHMLVLDGVYSEHQGQARFNAVTATTAEQMEWLLDRIITRTLRQHLRMQLTYSANSPWGKLKFNSCNRVWNLGLDRSGSHFGPRPRPRI